MTPEQRLFLLTAHPDTWEITLADVPAWLVDECVQGGWVTLVRPGAAKLTPAGHAIWRDLRGPV